MLFFLPYTEAQYASTLNVPIIPLRYQHGYKPRGWLGLLINSLLYYEVHSESSLIENLPEIKNALDKCLSHDEDAESGSHFHPASPNIIS